ncbi:hypothetical protein [Pollutimonas sp. M17]|uniref:hypothetical protein n=1 Tax=Pollutimonas sp. M17 TaxID=2962065 RepID=UPI0021F3E358|nr:hypothetical protein [Pollutimonas sp. M17]UYO94290.1 hypothetical protein OEG81_02850 [Pollutimonas sp. M17]
MVEFLFRRHTMAGLSTAVLLAACAAPSKPPPPEEPQPACQAAAQGDVLIGNWLSVRKEKGVAGELRTLFTLHPDGTMAYTEQLKRGSKPSQGLSETGCWTHSGQSLVLLTLQSNGAPVDTKDPIYTNRYVVSSLGGKSLSMRHADGTPIKARLMSPGYRLPF